MSSAECCCPEALLPISIVPSKRTKHGNTGPIVRGMRTTPVTDRRGNAPLTDLAAFARTFPRLIFHHGTVVNPHAYPNRADGRYRPGLDHLLHRPLPVVSDLPHVNAATREYLAALAFRLADFVAALGGLTLTVA